MTLEITQVSDRAGATAYCTVEEVSVPFDHPGLVGDSLDDVLGMLSNPMPSFHFGFYVGRIGTDVVAAGFLGLTQLDNLHTAHLHVNVLPEARRRGYGMKMARFLLDGARSAKRRLAIWETGAPLSSTSPGNQMAGRLGATVTLVSIRRELRLAELDRVQLEERLRALQGGPAAGYEVYSWAGPCPAHLVDGVAEIFPLVMSDSPQGDLDLEDEVWDVARYREYETMLASRRRDWMASCAVERSSETMVAYTDLTIPESDHRVVSQEGTAVVPGHRGHRLGLVVKTANVLRLMEAHSGVESVQTFNANENVHMIAVNEAMGFRAVERSTTWQLEL